jgi:D-glycero-D-manno-heptose 1,7-bisphosphate phosphatase
MSGIFLDRDGVIIRKATEGDYIKNVNEIEFLPGSLDAIAELSRFGFKIVIVTNQRGIATGRIKRSDLEDIHDKVRQAVAQLGGDLSDICYCPHDVSEGCMCRKPKAGMLLRSAEKFQLLLSECWMVGDAPTDITAGKSVGCKTALITQSNDFLDWVDQPYILASSLAYAAKQIIHMVSAKNSQNRRDLRKTEELF